ARLGLAAHPIDHRTTASGKARACSNPRAAFILNRVAPGIAPMNAVRLLAGLVLLLAAGALPAQSIKPPTAADVKALLAKYHAERDAVAQKGIAQRFPAAFLERADVLAKKGAAMVEAGRFVQA